MAGGADVSKTDLPVGRSNLKSSDGCVYRLEENYTNHAGDSFSEGELLILYRSCQLVRPQSRLGGPAIAFWSVITKEAEKGVK